MSYDLEVTNKRAWLREKKSTVKKLTVYLVVASSNLLDSTQHIRHFILVWFDQTLARQPAYIEGIDSKRRTGEAKRRAEWD